MVQQFAPPFDKVLAFLPWQLPLEEWREKRFSFIQFRMGLSRHVVRFIRVNNWSFAVKQTTPALAELEITNYTRLLTTPVHTLTPVGFVVVRKPPLRVEVPHGIAYENADVAFVVTKLEDKALPDYVLFRMPLQNRTKKVLLDAVAELLARLHFHNVYWGDASLSNLLIRLTKQKDQKGRVRTAVRALLADAETLSFLSVLSREMRFSEISFFIESMEWTRQDLVASGKKPLRGGGKTEAQFLIRRYKYHARILKAVAAFEQYTGLDVNSNFGIISKTASLKVLRKQILEHKWYLSETAGREVSVKSAAADWQAAVYLPVIEELRKLNIFEYLPFTSPAGLYIDIMTHKYYLSRQQGRDVGIAYTVRHFAANHRQASAPAGLLRFFNLLIKPFRALIPGIA